MQTYPLQPRRRRGEQEGEGADIDLDTFDTVRRDKLHKRIHDDLPRQRPLHMVYTAGNDIFPLRKIYLFKSLTRGDRLLKYKRISVLKFYLYAQAVFPHLLVN